jgi:hypothetical protein
MLSESGQELQRELRSRVGKFLTGSESVRRGALDSIIDRIRERDWKAVLFGGTVRDLMVYGVSKPPRDVDIVVAGPAAEELAEVFGELVSARTRFGGLHLQSNGWMFDIWPLTDTWAFKNLGYPPSLREFANLPRTTFLNVEAVAVELTTLRGKGRKVHSHGFFEALLSRTLEINCEDNPFPALCVVRALITAARLDFSIGPRLSQYLVHYGEVFSPEELVQVQISHYGWCRRTAGDFETWLNAIREQRETRTAGGNGVRLPIAHEQQLQLFGDWTPAW